VKRRADPNQTLINWGNPQAPVVASTSTVPDPIKLAAAAPLALVQRLRWDFTNTFPEPTEEALDAGVISDDDCTPERIKSIHDEHAREALGVLRDLDIVMDARRRGIDSKTGKPPRTHASRENLKRYHQDEPKRLEQYFHILMETYENAFGVEAADAFTKCIRARHAGIPVEMEDRRSEKLTAGQQYFEGAAMKPAATAIMPSDCLRECAKTVNSRVCNARKADTRYTRIRDGFQSLFCPSPNQITLILPRVANWRAVRSPPRQQPPHRA
jgi:hypothetical protein